MHTALSRSKNCITTDVPREEKVVTWVENKESNPNTNTGYQRNIRSCPNIDIPRIWLRYSRERTSPNTDMGYHWYSYPFFSAQTALSSENIASQQMFCEKRRWSRCICSQRKHRVRKMHGIVSLALDEGRVIFFHFVERLFVKRVTP